MATTYIDLDASAGGNDGSEGNPYASLSEWDSNVATKDLVTATEGHTVIITGTTSSPQSEGVALSGWTASGTYPLIIQGASRLSGAWDTGKAILVADASGPHIDASTGSFTTSSGTPALQIKYLQFEHQSTTANIPCVTGPQDGIWFEGCHMRLTNASGTPDGLDMTANADATTYNKIFNCIFDGGAGNADTGVGVVGASGNNFIYNNTFYNWNIACNGTFETLTLKNNIFQSNTSDLDATDEETGASVDNVTDGSATGLTGFTGSITVTFTDASNGDFTTTDSDVAGQGTDLSADSDINVTDDIAGTTRPATPYIGAYEEPATPIATAVFTTGHAQRNVRHSGRY